MTEEIFVIGIDLGGSHVTAACFERQGRIHNKVFHDINPLEPPSEILNNGIVPAVCKAIEESGLDFSKIVGIGMGLPGALDSNLGICLFSPNLKWRNVPIKEPLEKALKLPVFILNDVRSATLGEKYFGAGRGFEHFVCMAVGTGIGGGIVANGKLVLGGCEGAGEIGHITIMPDGPLCNCGNHGCMEALASGPNIARRAKEALAKGEESIIRQMVKNLEEISAETINRAAEKNDPLALRIWEETGRFLGMGVSMIITTLNPQRIIVGGRVAQAGELIFKPMREEIKKRVKMIPEDYTGIVPAHFKEDAGVVGAAALALEKLGLIS